MAISSEISKLLRNLGLTETEADVYLALLKAARGKPVSGYKVAKIMGRDPANLAKTLASLGRHGAVRVVQEKPRLFLPVPPDEFTGQVLDKLVSTQKHVVELLREFEATPPAGTALALAGPDQVLERARLMLGNCRSEALVFASPGICTHLSALLENLGVSRSCRVNIISTQSISITGSQETILALPEGLSDPFEMPWLQLVIDREVWLVAQLRPEGTPQIPSGWWGEDPGLAMVLAASLNAVASNPTETAHMPTFNPIAEIESPPTPDSFSQDETTETIPEPAVEEREVAVEGEAVAEGEATTEGEAAAEGEAITEVGVNNDTTDTAGEESSTKPDLPGPTPQVPTQAPEPSPEPAPPPIPEPSPEPDLTDEEDPDSDGGFQFIIRHGNDSEE
ncbi:MAG: hypothetical protein KOO60_12250 [Gemmatimonadales bacterium]|nr:hypothetical protein [Gemmatimonadales bacterium]